MNRLPDLEAWAVFARVAETGSFVQAAQDLGLSKATVSKTVTRLEQRLGVPLLHRTSRRVSLTETGQRSAVKARQMLVDAEEFEAAAMAEAKAPHGLVRFAAPMSFGLAYLTPLLPEFLAAHPRISIDLRLNDAQEDLIEGGYDAAIRVADMVDSTMRVQRLCRVRRLVVGSPAYFASHGRPTHPADLVRHACLGYAHLPKPDRWHFTHASGEEAEVTPKGPLLANNADALIPVLRAGLGLSLQPEFTVWDDLGSGRLEAVMPDWSSPQIAVNLVLPPGRARTARVATLLDFLKARLGRAPWAKPGND